MITSQQRPLLRSIALGIKYDEFSVRCGARVAESVNKVSDRAFCETVQCRTPIIFDIRKLCKSKCESYGARLGSKDTSIRFFESHNYPNYCNYHSSTTPQKLRFDKCIDRTSRYIFWLDDIVFNFKAERRTMTLSMSVKLSRTKVVRRLD